MQTSLLSTKIKSHGYNLGFDLIGFAKADFMEEEARDLEAWLNERKHGEMHYMANHFDKRTDPRLLVDGAKSVISVMHNYFPGEGVSQPEGAPKISRYAWGKDYHKVLKNKLYRLLEFIQEEVKTEVNARVFVDSAPVLDKHWAKRAGLGWIGKHTNLIAPQKGSWFFIGEIILDVPLQYSEGPIQDYCGTCTRCIDACPTDALSPYQIDANKCISYLTIELKDAMEESYGDQLEGWTYGCDICQEVCPWNRFSVKTNEADFQPLDQILLMGKDDWSELEKSTFKWLAKKTPMNRIKWEKMQHNLSLTIPTGH
ncbi:MAG: tRNA epoxyqueuosine(34) reductase QueG [Bacteroidia bacterium]